MLGAHLGLNPGALHAWYLSYTLGRFNDTGKFLLNRSEDFYTYFHKYLSRISKSSFVDFWFSLTHSICIDLRCFVSGDALWQGMLCVGDALCRDALYLGMLCGWGCFVGGCFVGGCFVEAPFGQIRICGYKKFQIVFLLFLCFFMGSRSEKIRFFFQSTFVTWIRFFLDRILRPDGLD